MRKTNSKKYRMYAAIHAALSLVVLVAGIVLLENGQLVGIVLTSIGVGAFFVWLGIYVDEVRSNEKV